MSDPILVECLAKRQGGTVVDFDDAEAPDGRVSYHFKDDGTGRHVAPVSNEAHLQRFASITEGFRIRMHPTAAASAGHGLGAQVQSEIASGVDAAAAAAKAQADADAAAAKAAEAAAAREAGKDAGKDADSPEAEMAALRAEYQRVTGQPARHNAKAETLRAQIAAFTDAKA